MYYSGMMTSMVVVRRLMERMMFRSAGSVGCMHALIASDELVRTHNPNMNDITSNGMMPYVETWKRCFSRTSMQHYSSESESDPSKGKWMPSWLKSRLPGALGGDREDISSLENMTLDSFASNIKQARRLGSLTGFVHGTSGISDSSAQGSMRVFENIIEAMTEQEKSDLSLFDGSARLRVAEQVGCNLQQVDDCIARYLFFRGMAQKLAELRRKGKEMPKSIADLEKLVGNWKQYRTQKSIDFHNSARGNVQEGNVSIPASNIEGIHVPMDARDPKGRPCPLAGMVVGKNTKCLLTGKSYKACCGKRKI